MKLYELYNEELTKKAFLGKYLQKTFKPVMKEVAEETTKKELPAALKDINNSITKKLLLGGALVGAPATYGAYELGKTKAENEIEKKRKMEEILRLLGGK